MWLKMGKWVTEYSVNILAPMNPWSFKKTKPTAQGDVDSGWREGSGPSLRATVNIPG